MNQPSSTTTFWQESFINRLTEEGLSKVTVKNYASDINHFVSWSTKNGYPISTPPSAIQVEDYISYNLMNENIKTAKRRISSVRKLTNFLGVSTRANTNTKLPFVHLAAILLIVLAFISSLPQLLRYKNLSVQDTIQLKGLDIGQASVTASEAKFVNSKNTPTIIISESQPSSPANFDSSQFEIQNDTPIIIEKNSGTATIKKGQSSTVVNSPLINKNSYIFITPSTKTNNQVIFISNLEEGYFVASISDKALDNIEFNWFSVTQ